MEQNHIDPMIFDHSSPPSLEMLYWEQQITIASSHLNLLYSLIKKYLTLGVTSPTHHPTLEELVIEQTNGTTDIATILEAVERVKLISSESAVLAAAIQEVTARSKDIMEIIYLLNELGVYWSNVDSIINNIEHYSQKELRVSALQLFHHLARTQVKLLDKNFDLSLTDSLFAKIRFYLNDAFKDNGVDWHVWLEVLINQIIADLGYIDESLSSKVDGKLLLYLTHLLEMAERPRVITNRVMNMAVKIERLVRLRSSYLVSRLETLDGDLEVVLKKQRSYEEELEVLEVVISMLDETVSATKAFRRSSRLRDHYNAKANYVRTCHQLALHDPGKVNLNKLLKAVETILYFKRENNNFADEPIQLLELVIEILPILPGYSGDELHQDARISQIQSYTFKELMLAYLQRQIVA